MSVTDASTSRGSVASAPEPACDRRARAAEHARAARPPHALDSPGAADHAPAARPPHAPDPPRVAGAPLLAPADREAAARRTLRSQVAKLERELAALAARARGGDAIDWTLAAVPPAGPRLLDLGELERLRDDLAARLHDVRQILAARAAREAERRALLERMLRDPAEHRFLRITRADVGEPGCGAWESRPRLGLIGMLAGWWHVKISSGCPLRS